MLKCCVCEFETTLSFSYPALSSSFFYVEPESEFHLPVPYFFCRLCFDAISIGFAHFGNKTKDYVILLVFLVEFSCLNVAPLDQL